MDKFDYETFNKRYDKFKNNNLPTPFFDEERQTLEYVYFDNKSDDESISLQINANLSKALEDICHTALYYSFSIRPIGGVVDKDDTIEENGNIHCHAHSLEEVVTMLYKFPESFNIAKDEEEFYSKQELSYLKKIQSYLLLIGLKDIENSDIPFERYQNNNCSKYND